MTEEEQQALDAIIPLIRDYRDDVGILNILRTEAENAFGEEWRTVIPTLLKNIHLDDINKINSNFHQALDYENAVEAWNEANRILAGEEISLEHLRARIPALEYWLGMFGSAGEEVVAKMKTLADKRSADELSSPDVDMASPYAEDGKFSKEISWEFEYFNRLRNYYDQTISRVGARCVQMGGLEMSTYPYFDYVLDVLSELVTIGEKMLSDDKYADIIVEKFSGGKDALGKLIADYKKELENNAPPEMVEEKVDTTNVKDLLGSIDTSVDNSPIGPAADGFEPIPDLEGV